MQTASMVKDALDVALARHQIPTRIIANLDQIAAAVSARGEQLALDSLLAQGDLTLRGLLDIAQVRAANRPAVVSAFIVRRAAGDALWNDLSSAGAATANVDGLRSAYGAARIAGFHHGRPRRSWRPWARP
jgi:hypothetical protein